MTLVEGEQLTKIVSNIKRIEASKSVFQYLSSQNKIEFHETLNTTSVGWLYAQFLFRIQIIVASLEKFCVRTLLDQGYYLADNIKYYSVDIALFP